MNYNSSFLIEWVSHLMKRDALIKQFPWTNHPLVLSFADCFSEEQWHDLSAFGVSDLLKKNQMSDEKLFKLLKNIHEVSNYPEVIEYFKSGQHSFKDLIQSQMEEISQSKDEADKTQGSETLFLLANGFDRTILDELFDTLDKEAAINYASAVAKLLAHPKMTPEEKKHDLQAFLQLTMYPHNLFCKSKELASDVLNYLANELTYEQFASTSNSKKSALFKPSPSPLEFEKFKKESRALASFYNQCLQLLESELTDKTEMRTYRASLWLAMGF